MIAIPSKKDEPNWEHIGRMVGKKIETECSGKGAHFKSWGFHHHDGGFFGRALFITGVILLLNTWGILQGVNVWIMVLIAAGFALMRF